MAAYFLRKIIVLNASWFITSIAAATKTIPTIAYESGDSSGKISQLKTAPSTGIINFQVFKYEIFMPGRFSKVNHNAKAAADKKLSHDNEIQNSVGNARLS